MSYQKELISCVMPVYNRQQMVAEAIESVLAQTYESVELIIVDDGSTDNTAEIIKEYAHQYTSIIKAFRIKNQGPGAAREYGKNKAQGEFIHFLDSDDLILNEKYSTCIGAMHDAASKYHQPIESMIAYDVTHFYHIDKKEDAIVWNKTHQNISRILPDFIYQRAWATSTPIYHRNLIDKAGSIMPWDCEEDLEYDIRIGLLNPTLIHVNKHFTSFRAHGFGRTSVNKDSDITRYQKQIRARAYILDHLLKHLKHRDKVKKVDSINDDVLLHYSKSLFLICRQCFELNDKKSAIKAWQLAWKASQCKHIRQNLLLIIYRLMGVFINPKCFNR